MTDSFHTKARIRNISTERMGQALDDGKIVIVAGFQGVDEHYNITTLGRGGSDTTAVALAAVLGADACEIYTDVDGVYTTDPRVVPEARKIDRISYDEMLELASLGAGVMHSRSIEFAKKYGVPIHVRSSFSDAAGTWIVGEDDARRLGVERHRRRAGQGRGADHRSSACPTARGRPHAIFRRSREANIVVDMIVQNVATDGDDRGQLHRRRRRPRRDAPRGRGGRARRSAPRGSPTTPTSPRSRSSAWACGRTRAWPRRCSRRSPTPAINIQMITTSEIKISVLVERGSAVTALRAVHQAFALERRSPGALPRLSSRDRRPIPPPRPPRTVTALGRRAQGMEDLVISGVELDEGQARITVLNVPDQPGYAARSSARSPRPACSWT